MTSSINPFAIRPNDLGILTKAPENERDPRVPMAEEFASWAKMLALKDSGSDQGLGWIVPPRFEATGNRQLSISGTARIPVYRGDINLTNISINIPALINTSNTILANEQIFLVGLACEVGAQQDPTLGQVSFQYRNPDTQQITSIQKENSQRIRCFWGILQTTESITANQFYEALTLSADQSRILAIANKTSSGFVIGDFNFYALDPNWVAGKDYAVISDSIQLLPVCAVVRRQNITERGYTWGFGGEEPLAVDYSISSISTKHFVDQSVESKILNRIQEILQGNPGFNATYLKTVQNLTAGSSAGVSGRPGESAGSPNGSVNLANSQRVGFSNQFLSSTLSAEAVTASNDGLGNAVCIFSLNSSPSGTRFSDKRTDHKIYNTSGVEISSRGRFSNLGSGGSLVWTAEDNPDINPGAMVLFQPTINYPAGSGFNLSFNSIEKVWVNSIEIPTEDIRIAAETDLSQYVEPVGSQKKIVVFGPERSALHYIYSKVIVTSNAQGIAVIPSTEKGCFAFVQGKSGRIDAPIVTDLTPNTNYNALVYYPPREDETWQVQFKYCQYQGLNNASLVDGAVIVAPPLMIAHTQGGGASAFFGGSFRYIPVSLNLPIASSSPRGYELNTPITFANEIFAEEITMRLLTPLPGTFVDPGQVGQAINVTPITGISHPRSISAKLSIEGTDALLGCQAPPLKSGLPYQVVFVVCVEKNSNLYLIIATKNLSGGSLSCDPTAGTAIDIFGI